MNQFDALKVLGLAGQVTPELIKKTYKKACSLYHPDRNPVGLEMMKLVNVAYDTLKSFDGIASISTSAATYGEDVANALNAIITFGLTIEVCGAWVWVFGDTKSFSRLVLVGLLKNNAGISNLMMPKKRVHLEPTAWI